MDDPAEPSDECPRDPVRSPDMATPADDGSRELRTMLEGFVSEVDPASARPINGIAEPGWLVAAGGDIRDYLEISQRQSDTGDKFPYHPAFLVTTRAEPLLGCVGPTLPDPTQSCRGRAEGAEWRAGPLSLEPPGGGPGSGSGRGSRSWNCGRLDDPVRNPLFSILPLLDVFTRIAAHVHRSDPTSETFEGWQWQEGILVRVEVTRRIEPHVAPLDPRELVRNALQATARGLREAPVAREAARDALRGKFAGIDPGEVMLRTFRREGPATDRSPWNLGQIVPEYAYDPHAIARWFATAAARARIPYTSVRLSGSRSLLGARKAAVWRIPPEGDGGDYIDPVAMRYDTLPALCVGLDGALLVPSDGGYRPAAETDGYRAVIGHLGLSWIWNVLKLTPL